MRIAVITESLDGKSGWATYARDLSDALRERGHDVTAITDDELPDPIAMLTRPWLSFVHAMKINARLNDIKPDIIHVCTEPYALMLPYLGNWNRKAVLTIHGSYGIRPLEGWWTKALALKYCEEIAACITVSEYTKRVVTDKLHSLSPRVSEAFADKTTVIHNGIKLPDTWTERTDNDVKQILCVGEVKPRKGLIESIEACAAFKKRCDVPFHFSVAGTLNESSEYASQLLTLIEKHDLQENVSLLGKVSDEELKRLYRQADLYLMPAKTTHNTFEGFGLVYIEANAHGVPCIGPDTSGAAEAIQNGISGYAVNATKPDVICDAMVKVLKDDAIDRSACRRWAEEHDRTTVRKKTEKIYEGVMRRIQRMDDEK